MLEIYKCTIFGRIPSKKNSKQLFIRGGRPMMISSKAHSQFHKDAMLQIKRNNDNKDIQSITLDFYFPDDRKADLTNKAETIMDLLVDTRVIQDDRWQVTGEVHLHPKGIDRKNPRVEITIIYFKF